LLDPLTVAVNVWVCDGCRDIEAGVSEIETGAVTLRLNCADAEPPAFVAVIVKVEVPATVGVPLMTPVEEPSKSPAGSVPLAILQVMGAVPVAVRVWV
jgi:hypothetical protein